MTGTENHYIYISGRQSFSTGYCWSQCDNYWSVWRTIFIAIISERRMKPLLETALLSSISSWLWKIIAPDPKGPGLPEHEPYVVWEEIEEPERHISPLGKMYQQAEYMKTTENIDVNCIEPRYEYQGHLANPE
jgi:hypothetical protein